MCAWCIWANAGKKGTHLANPHGHLVGVGGPVVQVEHNHTENDGECDQDHGEHDVIDNDGHTQWRLRNLISQQQQKHSEGQQNIDGQTHLLTWWRKNDKLSDFRDLRDSFKFEAGQYNAEIHIYIRMYILWL